MRLLPGPLLLLLLASPLRAEPPAACWVPYAEFEGHVRHIDAEACPPGGPARGEGFCRLAIVQDAITVDAFREVGGQPCLTAARRMSLADFLARHGLAPGGERPR